MQKNPEDIWLSRDDELAVIKSTSISKSEKTKNTFQKMLENKELDVIIECNLKRVTKNLMKK